MATAEVPSWAQRLIDWFEMRSEKSPEMSVWYEYPYVAAKLLDLALAVEAEQYCNRNLGGSHTWKFERCNIPGGNAANDPWKVTIWKR